MDPMGDATKKQRNGILTCVSHDNSRTMGV